MRILKNIAKYTSKKEKDLNSGRKIKKIPKSFE